MKRLIALILAVAMMLTLAGCADNGVHDDSKPPENAAIGNDESSVSDDDIAIAGDPLPAVFFDGVVYWMAQTDRTFFSGDAVVSELREGWVCAEKIESKTNERVPSKNGETNDTGFVGCDVYKNPEYPNAVYLSCAKGYALFLEHSDESSMRLVARLEETERLDIGFEVIPETVTQCGATFKFTNTTEYTVWFSCNFAVTVVVFGTENDIIVPDFDVPDGEYTVEPGESVDVIIDWTRKYGSLPDGTYLLYMYPNYIDSQIGIPMAAKFQIGSGVFDTEGVEMSMPEEEVFEEDINLFANLEPSTVELSDIDGVSAYVDADDITRMRQTLWCRNDSDTDIASAMIALEVELHGRWYVLETYDIYASRVRRGGDSSGRIRNNGVNVLSEGKYRFIVAVYPNYAETPAGNVDNDNLGEAIYIVAEFEITAETNLTDKPDWYPGKLGNESSIEIGSIDGFTFEVDPDTLTGAGAAFVYTNQSGNDISYGAPWHLEKEVDGKWYYLADTYGDYDAWPAVMMWVQNGETVRDETNFANAYGVLADGHYRYIKHFSIGERGEDIYHAAEFWISEDLRAEPPIS